MSTIEESFNKKSSPLNSKSPMFGVQYVMVEGKQMAALQIRPYTTKELAGLYDVDWRTFQTWLTPFLEQLGEKRGKFWSIPQVKIIFEKLDYPSLIHLNLF